jgi:hypothetical protein
MVKQTGREVLFSPITYFFKDESDARGFLKCVTGANGRPSTCAAQWRCENEARQPRVDLRQMQSAQ